MPTKLRLRNLFKRRLIILPLSKLFYKIKLKPNHITVFMLICSILASSFLIFFNSFILFSIFIFLTMILDGVDGTLARISNQVTSFGGFFDSTLDRVSEFFIYITFYFFGFSFFIFGKSLYKILVLIILLSSYFTSYLRSKIGNLMKIDTDIGLFGRSERLFLVFIITLFLNSYIFSFGIILLSIGTVLTSLFRFFKYSKYIKEIR